MQQLITIETIPISIKYTGTHQLPGTEEARPPVRAAGSGNSGASPAPQEAPVKLSAHTRPIRLRTDSFVQGEGSGIYNLTYTATPRYDSEGRLSLDIKMGDSDSDSLPIRKFGRDIQSIIGNILGSDNGISYEVDNMQLNINFSDLQKTAPGSGQTGKSFTPPSFEIEILEMPKVIVKYVGGPIYIPRSADPNYDPPAE